MKKISIALGIIIVGAFIWLWCYLETPYVGVTPAWIYLPRGTTKEAMADTLEKHLGHKTADAVMSLYSMFNYGKPNPRPRGAYKIYPGLPARNIAYRITHGYETPVRVTINNVRTLDQLAQKMSAKMDFTAEEWNAALDTVLPAHGFTSRDQYLAAFLPNTYEFYWTHHPETVAKLLLDSRNCFWDEENRARADSLGLNPVKVATICSIAEEETNNREERATVGRLYLNRLRKGMKLQADPTVKFALGDFSIRRIRLNHLKVDSPYNTYKVTGLPPGPIRMPERQTMKDFLDAPDNNYIYMCAKEDFSGLHNFAADYATHQANARRYQQALNNRGIN